jgi:tetratricopeptide (TPR) repeat protein
MARLVLDIDPKAVEAHLLLGELYRGQKRIDLAIGHFQRAWDLEPDDHKLAIALADMNIETGHPGQALAALRKVVQAGQGPGSPLAVEIRAQASKLLVRLGQPDLAESLLQDLVREQRGNPAHWTQLGLAQLDRGQGDQAIRSFQQALQLDPKQALALSGLGTLHLNLFRQRRDRRGLQLAAGFFSRALEADTRLITAVNGLGVVHLYLGDAPKAIEQFRSAITIDPGFVNAYFNLAIAQLRAGRRVEARRTLETLEKKLAARLSVAEREQLAALLREANS